MQNHNVKNFAHLSIFSIFTKVCDQETSAIKELAVILKTILIIFVALILPPRYVSGQTTNRIPFNLVYAEKFHAKFIQWASLGSKFDDFPGIFSVSIYTDTLSIDSLYVDSVMLVLAKQVLPHGSAYKKEDIASVTVIPKSKS